MNEEKGEFTVTFIDDMATGETAEITINAHCVEIVNGDLCFFDNAGAIGGFWKRPQRKLVAAYAAGIWTEFYEADWQEVDAPEWEPLSPELEDELKVAAAKLRPFGKDGSVAGG